MGKVVTLHTLRAETGDAAGGGTLRSGLGRGDGREETGSKISAS